MKNLPRITVFLITCLLYWSLPSVGSMQETAKPNLAVLEFTPSDKSPDAADWAFGVGDLLEFELQKRGVPTCERQQIGYLISERRLQSGGAVRAEDVIHEKLPSVAYLMKGRVEKTGDKAFLVTVSLVETKSWQEVAAFQESGKYPDGLAQAVAKIAQQASEKVGRNSVGSPSVKVPAGFTNSPEVALLYFKGIEHCVGGAPEYGVAYFTLAAQKDPTFAVARLWKVRAYEMLGLGRLAAGARENLIKSPRGRELNASFVSGSSQRGQIYAVSVGKNCDTRATQELWSKFKEELTKSGTVHLFSSDWINAYAAENDLRLTGMFEDGSRLAEMQWIGAQVTILFDGNSQGEVAVKALNVFTGEVKFSKKCSANAASLSALAVEVQAAFLKKGSASAEVGNGYAVGENSPEIGGAKTQLDSFAISIAGAAQKPTHQEALRLLAEQLHTNDRTLAPITWDWLYETIDPKQPDAALRYSTALWGKRWASIHLAGQKPFRAESDFAVLLRNYPASLPTQFARYALAHELLDAGKHAEAAAILEDLADRLPKMIPDQIKSVPDFWASLYYYAAMEALEVKHWQQAQTNLAKAEKIVSNLKVDLPVLSGMGWVYKPSYPITSQLQPGFNYSWGKKTASGEYRSHLANDIAALRERMNHPGFAPIVFSEKLYKNLINTEGPEAIQVRRQFLESILADKARNLKSYRGEDVTKGDSVRVRVRQAERALEWLWPRTRSDAERASLVEFARRIAEGTRLDFQISLYKSVDDRNRAITAMKAQIHDIQKEHDAQTGRDIDYIIKTGELLRYTDGVSAPANYLQSQLKKVLASDSRHPEWIMAVSTLGLAAGCAAQEAGAWDQACQCYSALFQIPSIAPDIKWSVACFWADAEQMRGNIFKATELLRQAVEKSTEQKWFLHTTYNTSNASIGHQRKSGDDSLSSEALARLNAVRTLGKFPCPPVAELPPAMIYAPIDPEIAGTLHNLLVDYSCRRNHQSPDPLASAFLDKYGHRAVPAILAATRSPDPLQVTPLLLEMARRVAIAKDSAEVLRVFQTQPTFFDLAFKLVPRELPPFLKSTSTIVSQIAEVLVLTIARTFLGWWTLWSRTACADSILTF